MIFIKDNFISLELCDRIIQSSTVEGSSRVIDSGQEKIVDLEYRNSKKIRLPKNLESDITSQLINLLPEITSKIKVKDTLEIEKVKGLKYEKGHFFKRHRDVGESGLSALRVLTAIIFLNNEANEETAEGVFSGGELMLYNLFPNNPKAGFPVKAITGRLVVFPSNLPHEVTEIIKGTRYTLVAWFLKNNTI